MYHTHFGLREEPFGVTPDRRFFCPTTQHREAVATLFYAIQERRGFALLLGRAGLGKTTVLFTLVQMLKGKAQIAYLANPYYDRTTVLDSILASLGLEPAASPAASHKLFYQYLLKTQSAGKNVVVVFDEAQDLHRDTLEAIRMLSNFETPPGKLVQIILAGQDNLHQLSRGRFEVREHADGFEGVAVQVLGFIEYDDDVLSGALGFKQVLEI